MSVKLKDFLDSLNKALESNTCYLQGGFGQRLWVPDWYNANYDWNKKNAYIINLHKNPNEKCYGFDCICLIKAACWNFSADPSKEFGGSKYQSNSVPDTTVAGFASSCPDYSTDFSKDPDIGEILFYDKKGSHAGVYIGNGEVIESTPAWACGVQKTLLPDRLNPNKLPVRKWYAHGHTSYIDYSESVNTWEQAYILMQYKYNEIREQRDALVLENDNLKDKLNKIKELVN